MSTEQDPTVADLKKGWPPTEQTIIALYATERTWPGDSAEVTAWRSEIVSYMSEYVTEFEQKYTKMEGLQYPNGKPANANTEGWSACRETLGWKALDKLDGLFHQIYDEHGPGYLTFQVPVVETQKKPVPDVSATMVFYWGKQPKALEYVKSWRVFETAPDLYRSTGPSGTAVPPSTTGDVGHGSSAKCTIL